MRAICTAALTTSLLLPLPAWSQLPTATKQAAEIPAPASARHVLAKTLTVEVGAAVAFMTIFGIGTGSLPAASVLTTGTLVIGAVAYPINEYLWDYYSPNTNLPANNPTFDASNSLWRTTYKYLSFKVSILASKFGWLYLYTGSVVSTVTMGTASSLALPAVFYLNDTAWDWYDWSAAAPVTPKSQTAAPAVPQRQ